ncbi:hypothetical protein BDR26DRAFT_882021 [Obelidium mucronatum]|nr:hypothetical protein BDR26DRAFT_882021 [Obelidium mucronatum]
MPRCLPCPACALAFCNNSCLASHQSKAHSSSSAQPTTTTTTTTTTPTAASNPSDSVFSPLLKRISAKLSTCSDALALLKVSSTTGSLYGKTPSPHRVSVSVSRQHLESIFDFGEPGTTAAAKVKDGILVYWHFGGTGGPVPYGSCEASFYGTRVPLGGISVGTEKLDITQAFRSQCATFQREYNNKKNDTHTFQFTINFSYKVSLVSLQTAIVVHKKLNPQESVAKLYQSILVEKGLLKPDSSTTTTNGLVLAPKATRNLLELQKEVAKAFDGTKPLPVTATAAAQAAEDDVSVGDSTITFSCPLALIRIKHPAKGKNCKHKQVFDAETFLSFNEKKDTWKCVVCNLRIEQNDLIIDTDMLRLLQKYSTADKCIVKANGEDCPFVEAQSAPVATHTMMDSVMVMPPTRKAIVVDDDGVIRRHSAPVIGIQAAAVKRRISEVICLDESDDETPLAQRQRRQYSPSSKPVNLEIITSVGEGGKVVETIVID